MKKLFVLLFLILTIPVVGLMAQTEVTGVVTDENDTPIPGANVIIKGTTKGGITDLSGKYKVEVNDPAKDVLVFSFIGYNSEEMAVNGRTKIDVQLIPSIEQLDAVVVIGYESVKKKDLTASVASVSAKQLKDIPVSSAAQAITGRLAGVQITTTEGSPNADVKIRVRGGGSITQDNSPLYIVDGFPVDGISDISPSDIASIDVLKDASSTAIYGARGANGVVIITTKGGHKGKLQVNYNFYYGVKKLPERTQSAESL